MRIGQFPPISARAHKKIADPTEPASVLQETSKAYANNLIASFEIYAIGLL
ncbi:MAG: hypothetical protein ABIH77_03595 [Pseudomonadota bacterium]|nr:hypothetical protein [Gammaproteobacteria bacterium]MBU1558496.1 hypothetical protein [Gammaproteobacteria bacterium]MBU1927331.1 hypothetical protein [Gammaproteobacteria bacterium]MBU2546437.1 hypothetical protein [Gammaproteobacteria bacterium]